MADVPNFLVRMRLSYECFDAGGLRGPECNPTLPAQVLVTTKRASERDTFGFLSAYQEGNTARCDGVCLIRCERRDTRKKKGKLDTLDVSTDFQ